MKFVSSLFVSFALALSALAQTPNPNPSANVATNNGQFTLSARAVAVSGAAGSVAASDIGGTFAVTTSLSLRSDNLIVANSQGYFGGVQYFLPSSKLLAKTNFDPSTFQFYLTASGGEVLTNSVKHPGFLAGGGINYDPTHTGKFTVNVIEVRAARLPYISTGVTALVSGGVSLGW